MSRFCLDGVGGLCVEDHDGESRHIGGLGPNNFGSFQLEGFFYESELRELCRNDRNHRPEARVGSSHMPSREKRTQRDGQAMVVFLRSSR